MEPAATERIRGLKYLINLEKWIDSSKWLNRKSLIKGFVSQFEE